MQNIATDVIERIGGTRKAASLLGLPPSTVQSWKKAGFIPARRQAALMQAACAIGIELSPADLVPTASGDASKAAA